MKIGIIGGGLSGISLAYFLQNKKRIKSIEIFEKEDKHYVTVFVLSEYDSGEIQMVEPDRVEKTIWVDWNDKPEPLFLPLSNLLKQGFDPLG